MRCPRRLEALAVRRPPHAWDGGRAVLYEAEGGHLPLADGDQRRGGVQDADDVGRWEGSGFSSGFLADYVSKSEK